MNDIIARFIAAQKIATVCCADSANHPYCFHCFYAFNEKDGLLYYKSSPDVHHTQLMLQNRHIAGTIQPDKLNPLAIQGIQFEGELLASDHPLCSGASRNYYLKHPYGLALPGDVYTLQINKVKMTDNSRGFGKKILWERGHDPVK